MYEFQRKQRSMFEITQCMLVFDERNLIFYVNKNKTLNITGVVLP
jgi:hypothetical protein